MTITKERKIDQEVCKEISNYVELMIVSLNSVLIGAGEDRRGASCQAAIAKGYEKILSAELDTFVRCKKAGLKSGQIHSGSALAECFDVVATDPRGKATKAVAKVAKQMAKKCGETERHLLYYLTNAFPGQCSDASDASNFAQCIGDLVDCRACQMLNAFDGLNENCDAFDDGVLNASCQ